MQVYALRLTPGQDLKRELAAFTEREQITAGAIVTCVGSLTQATLRFAGRSDAAVRTGDLEIVSLVGTLSPDGLHLHLSASDADGNVFGGHVLDGCIVRTTAEVVLAAFPGLMFQRTLDPATGYKELVVNVP